MSERTGKPLCVFCSKAASPVNTLSHNDQHRTSWEKDIHALFLFFGVHHHKDVADLTFCDDCIKRIKYFAAQYYDWKTSHLELISTAKPLLDIMIKSQFNQVDDDDAETLRKKFIEGYQKKMSSLNLEGAARVGAFEVDFAHESIDLEEGHPDAQVEPEPVFLHQNEALKASLYKCPKCPEAFFCNQKRNSHINICKAYDMDSESDEDSMESEADPEQQVKSNSNGQHNVTAEQMEEDLDEEPLTLTSGGDDVQPDGGPIPEVDHFNHEVDDEQMDQIEKQTFSVSESLSMETMSHQEAGNEPSANLIVNLNSCSSNVDMESRDDSLHDFPSGTSSTVSENSGDIPDLGKVFNNIPTETPTVPQEGQVNNSDKLETRAPRKNLRSLFKCSKCRKTFTSNERRNLHVNECQRYENDSVSDDDSNDGVDNFEQDLRMHTNTGQNIIIVTQHVEQGDSNQESSALIFSGDHDNFDDSLDGMPDLTMEGDVGVCEERLLQLESARGKNVISQPLAEVTGEAVSEANITQVPTNVASTQSGNGSRNESQPSMSYAKSIPASRLVGLVSDLNENPSKKYKCNFLGCNKRYYHEQSLNNHKKIHTVGKQHACKWGGCQWKFYRKCELEIHYRKHTGEKPYKCTVCPRAFSNSNGLAYHKKTKHGSRPLGT